MKRSISNFPTTVSILVLLLSWAISFLDLDPSVKGLWPVVVALIVILISHKAVLGLFMGSLVGCLFLLEGNLGSAMKTLTTDHFFSSMEGSWRIGAILFTLTLGAFTFVIERGGGFDTLAQKMLESSKGNPKRRLEASTGLMGILCFFDGLANSLLIGRIAKPLADRVGVSRAKLAYIVDSTSSSIACIAFISTWIATQLSLIQQSIEGRDLDTSAYSLFFSSISQNFYCLFTLVLVVVTIIFRWDIGPMKRAKVTKAPHLENTSEPSTPIFVAIIPIVTLGVSIITLFYLWETTPLWPISSDKLTDAFSGSAGPYALTLGSIIGLITACLLFPKKRKEDIPAAVVDGAASMLTPLLILLMAWTFGSVLSELGTAKWLAETIGSGFSMDYFPAAIFVTGALISFTTGSSWGTMALLMPIALPAYLDLAGENPELLPAVIGAVFSGAVFGDHCSPFSDTTIVSAFSCGISAKEHVLTQLPYAGIAGAIAISVGYGGIANGVSPWICFLSGTLLIAGLGYFFTRQTVKTD